MRLLEVLLDERGHEDVAPELDVLADVQARGGGAEADLDRLGGLAGQGAVEGPLVADVDAERGAAMRLDAVGQVVEGARVRDVARGHLAAVAGPVGAGEVVDAVRERVPHAVALVGVGVGRRLNGVPLDDERVQVDHVDVAVEEVEDHLAGHARRQRAYGREDGSLGHGRI